MKLYERIENNNFDEIDRNRAIELIKGGNGHLVYNENYFKLQKENEELKEKENKIYKEVQESLAFEKFLIVKERKPDLFNQGRFYISQIIYDILNDTQNPEGIHKENKCIQYIDYISVQRVKDKIEKEIKYHERNILDIENTTMLKGKTAKEEAEIEFNKYAIVVLKKILQELIEESKED